MFRTMKVLCGLVIATFALAACTNTTNVHPPTSASSRLVDPLVQLQSEDSGFPGIVKAPPVIHVQATGMTNLSLKRPVEPVTGVTFFLTCQPASQFKVTMGTFYSGGCLPISIVSGGGFPLPAATDPLKIKVEVPKGVKFWLVGVPTQSDKNTN